MGGEQGKRTELEVRVKEMFTKQKPRVAPFIEVKVQYKQCILL
jgi:hypothetical protein